MDHWNTIDIVAAVLGIGSLALGYNRGFIAQLVSIAGLFVAYLVAYVLYDDVSPIVARFLPLDKFEAYGKYAFLVEGLNWNVYFYNALSFALLFFLVKVGMSVVGRMLHLIASIPGLKKLNQWSGAALALLEAVVLFTVAVHVMSVIPSDPLQNTLRESVAAGYVIDHMPELAAKLQSLWNQDSP
ncbi:CvpA family protein [Paenibacillus flagellatus]|uniref:CvpA family protein n=1 Tax=Paenibacillus flagellatus TaxID=2211139 RepID=A0A2V5K5V0_9BACL|nr:CvpA family protein [Paenibacillus flagellatus]PYI53133.1 CvpA family protein [Paenibacillus flagellatus]